MKRNFWISIFILFVISSCSTDHEGIRQVENSVVGKQSVQIEFASMQSTYEGTSPLSTTLEVENRSGQPFYLPWGMDPGYIFILVDLDSTYRTRFMQQLPTPNTDSHQYLSIAPGEKISSEFTIPAPIEPGRYNLCAEILFIGEAEFGYQNPKVCVPITYKNE